MESAWEQEKLGAKKLLAVGAADSYKHRIIMPQESKSSLHFLRALLNS
jgi:hypothetical protein